MSPNLTVVVTPDPLFRFDVVAVFNPTLNVAVVFAQDMERRFHGRGQVTEDISVLLVLEAPVHGVKHTVTLRVT